MSEERFDIHQRVTDQIIAMLEQGVGDFRLPWHKPSASMMRPVNVASKASYRGVNVISLWAAADAKTFVSGLWGTYRQWAALGAHVRKGEKATYVVFYKQPGGVNDTAVAEGTKRPRFARTEAGCACFAGFRRRTSRGS